MRVGNAAFHQLQLDIYGELLDSVYLFNKYGTPISNDLWVNHLGLYAEQIGPHGEALGTCPRPSRT